MGGLTLGQAIRAINVYSGEENSETDPAVDTDHQRAQNDVWVFAEIQKLMDTRRQMDGLINEQKHLPKWTRERVHRSTGH